MLPLNPNVDYIAIGILMLNAAFDPLLYAAVRKPVRKGYLEIIKWIIYALSCFVPRLRPKNNFGKSLFTCSDLNLKMYMSYNNSKPHTHMHPHTHTSHSYSTICSFYTDEVLGLKNTSKSYYKAEDQAKRTTEVNRPKITIDNSSTKLNHLMNTSSNDMTIDGESANTIISLSELQEVTMDTKSDNTVMKETTATYIT